MNRVGYDKLNVIGSQEKGHDVMVVAAGLDLYKISPDEEVLYHQGLYFVIHQHGPDYIYFGTLFGFRTLPPLDGKVAIAGGRNSHTELWFGVFVPTDKVRGWGIFIPYSVKDRVLGHVDMSVEEVEVETITIKSIL